MNEIERIEEERFVRSLISLWIQPDAPEWIIDYARTELRRQRGLLEEKDLKAMEKVNGRYSEDIMNSLVNLMNVFLKDHEIYKLMELVADAVATKEQENSHETCTSVSSVQDSCNPYGNGGLKMELKDLVGEHVLSGIDYNITSLERREEK